MESSNYKAEYVAFLKKFLDIKKPLKVVFDSGCGPAGMIVKEVFAHSDMEMTLINDTVDPDFKARAPNPLLPGAKDACADAVAKHEADLGVMFDADADRAMFVNKRGELVPAFVITALLAKTFTPPFVVDELVYESLKFLDALPADDLVPSRIGAYFIKKLVKEGSYTFGAEYSGHYYFKDFFGLDSGIFTAISVINALSASEKTLEEVQAEFGDHEIVTTEISTEGKDMPKLLASLESKYTPTAKNIEHRDGVTFVFEDFWANIRSSNTEPILRIVAGGRKSMHEKLREIEEFVRAS